MEALVLLNLLVKEQPSQLAVGGLTGGPALLT